MSDTLRAQLEQAISERWKGVHPETREEVFGYANLTLDAVEAEIPTTSGRDVILSAWSKGRAEGHLEVKQIIKDLRLSLSVRTTTTDEDQGSCTVTEPPTTADRNDQKGAKSR